MGKNTIGKRVQQLRKEKSITQLELSQILMIGHSTLACYESDKRQIPHDVLIKIAQYFDVSADYLLGLED